MNRTLKIALYSLAAFSMLLSSGCGKSEKDTVNSDAFAMKSSISEIDTLKAALPAKNPHDLDAYTRGGSDALQSALKLVPSAAGKAKVQKASDEFDKELMPTILSGQYDPPAMSKKLDGIKAVLAEVSKEVK
jgi:hypothetical protein